MSSPATYPRCSAKSTDAPKYGDRCMPLMNPSTTWRATSSRFPMRDRTTGSTKRAPGIEEVVSIFSASSYQLEPRTRSHARSWYRYGLEQPVDQRVRRDAFRLRVEIGQHAVAQDRVSHGTDVIEAHVIPAARERTRFRAEHQILGGA